MAEDKLEPLTEDEFRQINKWLTDRIFEYRAMQGAKRFLDLYKQGKAFLDTLDKEVISRQETVKSLEETVQRLQSLVPSARIDAERAQRETEEKKTTLSREVRDAWLERDKANSDRDKAVEALTTFKANAEKEAAKWAGMEKTAREKYEAFQAELAKLASK